MRVVLVAKTIVVDDIPGYEPHLDPYVQSADDVAEQAGRLCYESWSRSNAATATNSGYLSNIISQGHHSVLEHGSATFYIDGVSRTLTHELIRHRHLSFSEASQRYVDVSQWSCVVPPVMLELFRAAVDEGAKVGLPGWVTDAIDTGMMEDYESSEGYAEAVELLIEKGCSKKEARGAARWLLPASLETKIVVTGNHRAWREVISKRNSPQADAEIRQLAQELLSQLKVIAPNTYQDMKEVK